MYIKEIFFKNLGPYGNKLQNIKFDENGGLWMVSAKNGFGKSFLINLPKILFYGKLDGFKKDEIANRLNRHGEIEGIVNLNNNYDVTIKRNLSPSNLTVYKHDKDTLYTESDDIGKAGISNYQDYIDDEITKLPYHIFSNIITLSVNDFKSFISMSPGDKRIIIDKLFSMEILNKMYELIKKDLKLNKSNIEIYEREIISINNSIKNASNELKKLQEKIKNKNTQKAADIFNQIKEKKKIYDDNLKKYKQYKQKETELNDKYNAIQKQKQKLNLEVKEIKKKQDLFSQDKCPVCETPFTEKRFDLIKEELDSKQKEKSENILKLIDYDKTYKNALDKVKNVNKQLNEYLIQLSTTINNLSKEYTKLNEKTDNEEFNSIKKIIESNNIEIKKIEKQKNN